MLLHYEGVGGGPISTKKRYVTLEWPLKELHDLHKFHSLRHIIRFFHRCFNGSTALRMRAQYSYPPNGYDDGIRSQYGIDLPGSSLHTNKIPAILGRYPLLGFFCRLNIVPLDRDNGTFNSSHTDVVEKVNFLVAASQHGGTSVAEGSTWTEMALFWSLFKLGSFLVEFLKNEILGFDENLAVVL